MYTLQSEVLSVDVLDPVADRERFGTRYCTGGYIFQVTDTNYGPLLSGPTYPDSFNTYDGQGIPDAFNWNPLKDLQSTDAQALIIGIGRCDLEKNEVIEFCRWDVQQTETSIRMHTEQEFAHFALSLAREIRLYGRTVHSSITLDNTGRRLIPIRWFPHPFYPQTKGDELCRFNIPVSFPENDGYALADSGFIARKNWPHWERGYYQALTHKAHSNLVIISEAPNGGPGSRNVLLRA